jgi:NAD(P)-dependent dehydrogenase (short-subunit alcohol dehydrogenase family)
MEHPARQKGRHFAVTGASSGIGRAIAIRLGAEGANLTLIARRAELLEQVAAAAVEAGATLVQTVTADVRDRAAVDAAFAEGAEALGPLNGVVAAAGVGGPNLPGEEDRFLELIQTNLAGTYYSLRAAQRHLAEGPDARHMVVLASVLARFGVPGHTGYCASKAGLLGLVRALALELARENVAVNAVCPGWVETDMAWQGIDGFAASRGITREKALELEMRRVPLGRMSAPEDIAGLVAWLVSADARGVTGQGLDINNGAWMG